MRVRRVLPWVLGVLLATPPAIGGSPPVGVSPGDPARLVRIGDGCPTFSWGETERAEAHELAVYRLGEEGEDPQPVLRQRIVGSASSWTPSLADCLEPGGRYVWFVRAVREDDAGQAGGWSDGRYFATPAGPTVEDVRRALAVLAAWSESTGGEPAAELAGVEAPGEPAPGTVSTPRTGLHGVRSVPTATAALAAVQPDLTGETYGVVGMASSPDGAGVGAANLGNGPDLVLDGSAAGAVSTELTEAGIDRPAAADQTFSFQNSDAGQLHVSVGGNIQGITADVQELKVAGATVIDNSGAWQGGGDTVPCAGCVTSSDIEDATIVNADLAVNAVESTRILNGSIQRWDLIDDLINSAKIAPGQVLTSDIGDGQVTTAKIAEDAVTGAEILDTTITYRDLAADAVRTEHLLDGTVTGADIANDAVTGAKIAAGAVDSAAIANNSILGLDLANDAVTGVKIDDLTITAADLAVGAVTSPKILDGTITTADLADGAVTSAKLASSAVGTANLLDLAVTSGKLANDAVTAPKIADSVITADHVDPTGGLYASKSSLYLEWNDVVVTAGNAALAYAPCRDSNDLPLTTFCMITSAGGAAPEDIFLTEQGELFSFTPSNSYCSWHNKSAVSQTGRAAIACIAVPGP